MPGLLDDKGQPLPNYDPRVVQQQEMLGMLNRVAQGGNIDFTKMNPGQGYIEGGLARAANDRANVKTGLDINKDVREAEQLGMEKEAFGWKREDRERGLYIMAGMAEASKQGGYGAVVDWLKSVDPMMAMQVEGNKLDLDKKIMSNDLYKMSSDSAKNDILLQSYATLGKTGMGILQQKDPKVQADMYNIVAPMWNKILGGNAPTAWGPEARNLALLGVSQATPDNLLYQANKEGYKWQSKLGQLNGDIMALQESGATPDTSPELQSLLNQREAATVRLETSKMQKNNVEYQNMMQGMMTQEKQLAATRNVQNDIQSFSKPFNEKMQSLIALKGALNTLKTDPDSPAAKGMLGTAMAKASQSGALTENDYARSALGAGGGRALAKKINEYITGKLTKLDAAEVGDLANVIQNTSEIQVANQKAREAKYKENYGKFGQLVDINKLVLPSDQYEAISSYGPSGKQTRAAPEADIQAALTKGPKTLEAFVKTYGYDPRPKPANGAQ